MPEIEAAENGNELVATELKVVPEEKYAPKPKKKPSYLRTIANWADDEELAGNTMKWLQSYYNTFENQGQRQDFLDSMDLADELYRAAVDRSMLNSKEDQNVDGTKSKIRSATYYADLRYITSNEKSIALGVQETIPIRYEAIPGSTDYDAREGAQISNYQNLLLAYTWEVAEMDRAVGQELWRLNKYGNSVIEMVWDRRVQKLPKKKPIFKKTMFGLGPEDRSQVVDYKWVEEELTIADWPVLISYDMKDVWFDATINNTQDQSCILFRAQKQLEYIWALQRTGEYKNAGKIKTEHQYQGEGQSDTLDERLANAAEDGDVNMPNTLFDIWAAWIRLPIDADGKWSPEKVLPTWHRVVFVGDINGKNVCVQISPNPNSCGLIPMSINHALMDDKGAYHMGYHNLIQSMLAEEMTLFDMANDNMRNRNRVPILAEQGSILTNSKKFTDGGNQIISIKAGSKWPEELALQDTTSQTVPLLHEIDSRRERILGTNKAFVGEEIGGRQSASGYLGTLDQAMKPAVEDAKFKIMQILPFIGFWIKEMWSDFGDPERKICIAQGDEVVEVKPKYIWGDLKVRVTSIKNFQDNALRRKEMSEVLTQLVPQMVQAGAVNAGGLKKLYRQYLKERGIEDIDEILDTTVNQLAIQQAKTENMTILWGGGKDMPKQDDDHPIHIKQHELYLAPIKLLAEGSRPLDANIATMEQHIAIHKYMMGGEGGMQMAQQPGQQSGQQSTQPPMVESAGEEMGNEIAGTMGSMANLPQAETGRPPLIEAQGVGGLPA
jgi:hypothetical protein